MPITSYKASQLCAAIYNPVDPGVFDKIVSINGVTVGHSIIDGTNSFTFAGSETPQDWFRDQAECDAFVAFIVANTAKEPAQALKRLLPNFCGCPSLYGKSFSIMLDETGKVASVTELISAINPVIRRYDCLA